MLMSWWTSEHQGSLGLRSGMCHAGRDSGRQTAHRVKGPVPALGTERREEDAKGEDYKTNEETRRLVLFSLKN